MFLNRLTSSGMKESPLWNSFTSVKMPNCTCYCIGEYLEQGGERKVLFSGREVMGFPTAKDFYSKWLGEKGAEPRIGGFAVWGSSTAKYGHVAYIYGVKARDGGWEINVSQSNFEGEYFELKTYFVKTGVKTSGVGFPYIGCCYNNIKDERTKRNSEKNQVQVIATNLQARRSPNGEKCNGLFVPEGVYDYKEIVHAGDYDWCNVDDIWFALNEGKWTYLYTNEVGSLEKEIADLKADNEKLTKAVSEAQTSIKSLTAVIEATKNYIDMIVKVLK